MSLIFPTDRLNPPPKKDETRSSRESHMRLHPAGARGKRASLAARPKQLQLPAASTRSLSPGRKSSRARSHSVQLSHSSLLTKKGTWTVKMYRARSVRISFRSQISGTVHVFQITVLHQNESGNWDEFECNGRRRRNQTGTWKTQSIS